MADREWSGLSEKVTYEFAVLDSKADPLQHHLPQSHFETATISISTLLTPRQILLELQRSLQPTLRILRVSFWFDKDRSVSPVFIWSENFVKSLNLRVFDIWTWYGTFETLAVWTLRDYPRLCKCDLSNDLWKAIIRMIFSLCKHLNGSSRPCLH